MLAYGESNQILILRQVNVLGLARNTGSPRYSRTLIQIVQNVQNLIFKKWPFICEFKIRGPTTAKNKGNLYTISECQLMNTVKPDITYTSG